MINIAFSQDEIKALRFERFHHSDPLVRLKMEVVYLRSQRMANREITRLCAISKPTFHRYLKEYVTGGIERLKQTRDYCPHSELFRHRAVIEADFRKDPPATVAEAAAKIETLTGIIRKPTQVRMFMKTIGMKPLKVGMIPAKVDVQAQEDFKKKAWNHA